MIRRLTALTLSTLLLAGTGLAEPMLQSDVLVASPVVTVGDMFADAGALAEVGLFRAPQPGTTGIVPLADVRAAANRAGLTGFNPAGLEAVRVTRSAALVDEALLNELINADLTARGILRQGMSADTLFSQPIAAINAEAVAEPAKIVSLRYLPGTGAFTARFVVAGYEQPLDLTGTIEVMIEVPHLVSSLAAGTVLAPEHLEMRAVPLRFAEPTGIVGIEDIVGQSLSRQSREGMMLKASDVQTPMLISKSDLVTIYFRKGPMTLSVKGQALTSATPGKPVQVLNLMSKRVISATALAAGAVEVSHDPLAIAGL